MPDADQSRSDRGRTPQSFGVSAPGKVILFGEHAVVYGKKAVAASLGLRTCAVARSHPSAIVLHLPDLGFVHSWPLQALENAVASASARLDATAVDVPHVQSLIEPLIPSTCSEPAKQAALAFLVLHSQICGSAASGIETKISSRLPVGAGLGSSASFSVCAATALLLHAQSLRPPAPKSAGFGPEDLHTINGWAFLAEKVIHGNPSGVDNSLCTFGGAQVYTKQDGMSKLNGFMSFDFVLTDTNVAKNTKREVEKVRLRREKFPAVMNPLLDAVQGISNACIDACEQRENGGVTSADLCTKLEELMDMNHMVLSAFGVSHPTLDHVRQLSSKHGFASKLTGAGGGGCAITLIRPGSTADQIANLTADLKAAGFHSFQAQVGCAGVLAGVLEDDNESMHMMNVHGIGAALGV